VFFSDNQPIRKLDATAVLLNTVDYIKRWAKLLFDSLPLVTLAVVFLIKTLGTVFFFAALCCLIITLSIYSFFYFRQLHFQLLPDEIRVKQGLLNTHFVVYHRAKIQDAIATQSVYERLKHRHTVSLSTSGGKGWEFTLSGISQEIYQQLDKTFDLQGFSQSSDYLGRIGFRDLIWFSLLTVSHKSLVFALSTIMLIASVSIPSLGIESVRERQEHDIQEITVQLPIKLSDKLLKDIANNNFLISHAFPEKMINQIPTYERKEGTFRHFVVSYSEQQPVIENATLDIKRIAALLTSFKTKPPQENTPFANLDVSNLSRDDTNLYLIELDEITSQTQLISDDFSHSVAVSLHNHLHEVADNFLESINIDAETSMGLDVPLKAITMQVMAGQASVVPTAIIPMILLFILFNSLYRLISFYNTRYYYHNNTLYAQQKLITTTTDRIKLKKIAYYRINKCKLMPFSLSFRYINGHDNRLVFTKKCLSGLEKLNSTIKMPSQIDSITAPQYNRFIVWVHFLVFALFKAAITFFLTIPLISTPYFSYAYFSIFTIIMASDLLFMVQHKRRRQYRQEAILTDRINTLETGILLRAWETVLLNKINRCDSSSDMIMRKLGYGHLTVTAKNGNTLHLHPPVNKITSTASLIEKGMKKYEN
jgi:membrane protein YdbS with pleckstrin-like domain